MKYAMQPKLLLYQKGGRELDEQMDWEKEEEGENTEM